MRRPLLAVACAFAAGTGVGSGLPVRTALHLLVLAAVLLASALGARSGQWRRAAVLATALAVGAAAAAVESRQYEAAPLAAWLAGHADAGPVLVRGVCQVDPREAEGRWILVIDVQDVAGVAARGRARVDVGGTSPRPALIQGDRVAVWADLRAPHGLSDPGSFDAAAQARGDGVHAVGW